MRLHGGSVSGRTKPRSDKKSNIPVEEKILLEKKLDFIPEKDQNGPTIDLFFHELVENESRPKKIFEWIAGFLGSIFFLITLPVLSLLVIITSGWPVFVPEKFPGYKGNKITRYLYRTHRTGNKDKTTLIGSILIMTGMCKLPNFVNILKGNMSLVGPKPLPSEISEEMNTRFTDFYKRFATKPGIIGIKNGKNWNQNQDYEALGKNLKTELRYLVYPTLKKDCKVIFGDFTSKKNPD